MHSRPAILLACSPVFPQPVDRLGDFFYGNKFAIVFSGRRPAFFSAGRHFPCANRGHQKAAKAESACFGQTYIDAGHTTHFAGKTDLPDGRGVRGNGKIEPTG
jgi:hypothetical protein